MTLQLSVLVVEVLTSVSIEPRPVVNLNCSLRGYWHTILGYLEIEIGSYSLFERLLWPTRFYNTLNPSTLFQITMLTPMGGPLLRPAICVIDGFIAARMHRGKQQGDPLDTAFFSDLGCRYRKHLPGKCSRESHTQQTD